MTEIREGDVVLIGYDYPTTRDQVERMRHELEDWFPGVEFRFICGTVQAVMRQEEFLVLPNDPPPRLGDLPRKLHGRHVEDVALPDVPPRPPDPFKPLDKCPHGRTKAARRQEPCPHGFPGCKVDL